MGVELGISIVVLPVGVLMLIVIGAGCGLILAGLAPRYGDVLEIFQVLLTVCFLTLPTFYPLS